MSEFHSDSEGDEIDIKEKFCLLTVCQINMHSNLKVNIVKPISK
jgi:hypothetical protein